MESGQQLASGLKEQGQQAVGEVQGQVQSSTQAVREPT